LEKLIAETEFTDEDKVNILKLGDFVRAGIQVAVEDFAERRRNIERLNVTGTLAIENGDQVLHIECVAGRNALQVANTTR